MSSGFRHVLMGDSVTGDTTVIINGGEVVSIESLFTGPDGNGKEYCASPNQVLTYDMITGKTVYRPIKYVMRHYTDKPIYRVWMNNSSWIDVTEDHSLMGYVNTQHRRKNEPAIVEVKPQDIGDHVKSLILLKRVPYNPQPELYPILLCELMGYTIGDGCMEPSGLMLSVGQQDMNEIATKLLDPLVEQEFMNGYRIRNNKHDVRLKGTALRDMLLDTIYINGHKTVPSWMKDQPEPNICAFLRGLFSADGTVTDNGRVIRLTTIDDALVHDVRTLLLRVGIASTWFTETTENHYKGKPSGTFSKHVVIKSRDEFIERIGFILDRKTRRVVAESTKLKTISIGDDVALYAPMRVELLSNPAGYVYDIEVEDTHTFFANGLLVHNTDSAYIRFDLYAEKHGIELNKETAVDLADQLQVVLERDLAVILANKFATDPKYIAILEPGREIVGRKALFKNKKKRYAIHVVDSEGKPKDDLKVMGMETRRSDTPAFVQEFLTDCLTKVVKEDISFSDLRVVVDTFRTEFRNRGSWTCGSPGRVRNLFRATEAFNHWVKQVENPSVIAPKKPSMHITIKAALSTNRLMDIHGEKRWDRIRDGDKVEIIYLLDNPDQLDCVAIKVGETYVPDWFKELPFDLTRMEEKLLDRKLFNVLGDVLDWDFTPPKTFSDEIVETMDDFYD